MINEQKHLSLSDDEDSWYCGSPLDNQTEFTAELFNLLEEKIRDSSVLSLPWTPQTEIVIEKLDVDTKNVITVQLGVIAYFDDINSLCKACENSINAEPELLEQVKTLVQSIRDCD